MCVGGRSFAVRDGVVASHDPLGHPRGVGIEDLGALLHDRYVRPDGASHPCLEGRGAGVHAVPGHERDVHVLLQWTGGGLEEPTAAEPVVDGVVAPVQPMPGFEQIGGGPRGDSRIALDHEHIK